MESEVFALMGRLHVILRRETGRITDIEYMRQDPAYCRHVLDLAAHSGNADVVALRERLESLYFGPAGLFVKPAQRPLLARGAAPHPFAATHAPAHDAGQAASKTYVGRLR